MFILNPIYMTEYQAARNYVPIGILGWPARVMILGQKAVHLVGREAHIAVNIPGG